MHGSHGGIIAADGGLLLALFVTGLLGGVTHCAGMCGPFVLAQIGASLERGPGTGFGELRRLRLGLLLPYHLGRATTYAAIGAAAALFADRLAAVADFLRWLPAALLLLAALLFLAQAAQALRLLPKAGGGAAWAGAVARAAGPLLRYSEGGRGYLLGVILGFIPCGLLYAAVAAAAATADPIGGAMGMLAFAAGTMAALVAVGWLGAAGLGRWRGLAARATPLLMLGNAVLLTGLAWRWLA